MTGVGAVYGKSLFDLAQEEGTVKEYMQELSLIRRAVEAEPQFLSLLDCRNVPLAERLQVLDTCFRDKIRVYLLSFMKILCQNGAIRHLPDCIRQYELLCNEYCGIVEAKCVSAVPLSPALQEKLTAKLQTATGKTVSLRCAVDKSVLGGLRLELMGKELDGTVRRRLDEIAKQLAELTI